MRGTRALGARTSARPLVAAAALGLGILSGAARLGHPAAASPPRPELTPAPGRLATSLETAAGTWATLPMGHPGARLDTFWQLFFRPRGGTRWSDEVAFLGVATNGGLVVGRSGTKALLVGIEPSNLLDFTPVAQTAGTGRSWTTGAPVPGAAVALAAQGASALALSAGATGGRLLAKAAPEATWRTLATAFTLMRTRSGRSCQVTALTAAAYGPSGAPLLGVACGRPGVVGVFLDERGAWQGVGPALPPALRAGRARVLRFQVTGERVVALLELDGRSGAELVAARLGPSHASWTLSAPVGLGGGDRLLAAGPAGASGQFVLVRAPSGAERLLVAEGRGTRWSSPSAPPRGTVTAAFGASGTVDALAASGSAMTDWRLRSGSSRWRKAEVVHVAILYGSSS